MGTLVLPHVLREPYTVRDSIVVGRGSQERGRMRLTNRVDSGSYCEVEAPTTLSGARTSLALY